MRMNALSVLLLLSVTGPAPAQQTVRAVDQHDVLPVLMLRCSPCHGLRRQEAGLDLRSREAILRGGKSGPSAVAHRANESLLVQRIQKGEMPPKRQLVSVSVKPVTATELRLIEAWIDQGLPEGGNSPSQSLEPTAELTDQDRDFWSFRPIVRPEIPTTANPWPRNPIDSFIAAKLRENDLQPNPEADRWTLARRLAFDLTGLPPDVPELLRFIDDSRSDSYERFVDRLLASPAYGERWGRYWLDVAGYADSEGAQNEDRIRPHMYRYRDYVVQSFNSDKPYARFLSEQIAGDELFDYTNTERISREMYDSLVATGFLRTAPDRTFANITNFVPDRLEVIADEVQILGSAVLGLTIHCARCHTHKFDPIPQRDYYRLLATLKDGLDEHDWLKPDQRFLTQVSSPERSSWLAEIAELQKETDRLVAAKAGADEATQKTLQEKINQLEKQKPPEPRIRAVWGRGVPSPTYVLRRGNYLTPGSLVAPGTLSVLSGNGGKLAFAKPNGGPSTGARLAFARWLTDRRHPLTSRVIVNRLWQHHFGNGLVTTPDNFGKTGDQPSHPGLLDWLAAELMESGWSLKRIHRLIATSATYRQSSRHSARHRRIDPENRLLARMPLRRLEAEAIRDALLQVSGALLEKPFGPADPVELKPGGLVLVNPVHGGWRRSIYVLQRRTQTPTMLAAFDFPQMNPNCVGRDESIVAPQALHLLNNAALLQLARSMAERVLDDAGDDSEGQIALVYLHALSRRPTPAELRLGETFLNDVRQQLQDTASGGPVELEAMTLFCHATFNSAAFLYVD